MPGKTDGLSNSSYIYMGFAEGWQFSYVSDFLHLYLYLKTHRSEIDLVHFFTTNLILFGPIIAYFAQVPSLVTLTGFGRVFTNTKLINRVLQPIYKVFLGISIRLSLRYLLQNFSDMRLLERNYPRQVNKFAFVGSGVDFQRMDIKDFSAPKLRVILVSRLLPDKGIDDFLRVAQELDGGSWEFVLIGPPSKGFDDLHKRVIDHHKCRIISYKGECSPKEVAIELSLAHIFYFPSCYPEGLSRTMLEAGFACLCPVAYDIPANRDLIADCRGFLLPVRDTSNVILTLERLLADRRLLLSHAYSYQSFITENYSMDKYAERMDSILRDLHKRNNINHEYNAQNDPFGS